jgi:hypothetical protein
MDMSLCAPGVTGKRPVGHTGEYGDTRTIADLLGVSESYLNKARCTGSGPPFHKFGSAVRYHIATALEWAAAQTHKSTSEYHEVA